MVIDRALKKAPVTPVRKARGTKITMVAAEEASRGRRNSDTARSMVGRPLSAPSARRRSICSIITMASSMIRPMAAAMPPRVMMLKLWPVIFSTRLVAASTAGTATTAARVTFQSRRNTSRTRAARITPMMMALRRDEAESRIRSLWSYQAFTCMSAGPWAARRWKAAWTSRAIWTVLPPGC